MIWKSNSYFIFNAYEKNEFLKGLKKRGLSLRDFAKIVGFSPSYISLIINGKRLYHSDYCNYFNFRFIDSYLSELDNIL